MNVEKLDTLFCQYGYIAKELKDNVRVYVLNQGMYHGAEVISLDGTNQEDTEIRFSKMGYSTFVQHFSSEFEAEEYLFKGFFNTQTTEDEIIRRYEEFSRNQIKHYGNSNIEYEYISMPYSVYRDSDSTTKEGTLDIIQAITNELNRKGAHLIIVEAAAGFGKTCTSYEIYNSFRENTKKQKPIFAELYKNREAKQFKYILWDEIDKEKDTNAKQGLVVYNIKKGRIPLIIDGFDELLSKDIDPGNADQPNEFEQVETMLSTIGDLLEEEAKIILTTRKTAIFTGAEFSEWVDSYKGNFDVIRFQLDKPNIREWLSPERFDKIENNQIPLSNISNPVLLTYLRNVDLQEFENLLNNPENITTKYFEHLLNREKERQALSIRWEDQMFIFENLARAFAEFDITGESRSFVKELLVDYNKSKLLYFREAMSTKQTLDELADTLTNHALLDRIGNKDYISFVNDFILGYLLGKSIVNDKNNYLSKQSSFPDYLVELAVNAFRYSSLEDKSILWRKLNEVRGKMSLSLSIETDTLLKNKLCKDLINEGVTSLNFENVSFDSSLCHISNTSFVDVVFEKCSFDIYAFENVTFTGCKFIDCEINNNTSDRNDHLIHCYGCEDFQSGFISGLTISNPDEIPSDIIKEDLEIEILGKYFKVDGRSPKMKYISSLRKEFEERDIEEVFNVFESLRKRGFIVTSGNNSHIRQEGISYYHKKIQ